MSTFDTKVEYDPATIWIYDQKKDEQREEISLLAYQKKDGKILAIGKEAISYQYQKDDDIVVMSPFKDGRVADFEIAVAMIKEMLGKNWKPTFHQRVKIALCIPEGATSVEKRAYSDMLYQAGSKEISLVETCYAEMKSQLSSDYRFLIAIEPKQKRTYDEKEVWKAVEPYKIPKGKYQFMQMTPQDEGVTFMLSDGIQKIQLCFQDVLAMRMLKKDIVTSSIYQENALYVLREQAYPDVVYEVCNGDFQSFLNEKGRRLSNASTKSFAIICVNDVIEVMSKDKPEITIMK